MPFSISLPLCRIYLQAVPCDPAGADFNFAALSFNSEFLHQIHLIPLHPHSPSERQRTFMVSAGKMMLADWKRKAREGDTRAFLITTFPLVRPVMCSDLRHSLPQSISLSLYLSCSAHAPSLPPPNPPISLALSLIQTLSGIGVFSYDVCSPMWHYIQLLQ